jgi:hypothetical protein
MENENLFVSIDFDKGIFPKSLPKISEVLFIF